MIYHHIVWLHVPVHYTFAVAEIQGFQELEDVESNVIVDEPRVQCSEISIVHILENQARRLALAVTDDIEQRNDIRPARQVLQDLDLALYFLLLDRLQDFDDAFLVVDDVDAFEHLGVFPSTWPSESVSENQIENEQGLFQPVEGG